LLLIQARANKAFSDENNECIYFTGSAWAPPSIHGVSLAGPAADVSFPLRLAARRMDPAPRKRFESCELAQ
jgi:hypothetical protein